MRVPAPLILGDVCGRLPRPRARARLWLVDARQAAHRASHLVRTARAVLDDTEWRRAGELRHARDRTCYLAAHVALRLLLGAHLDIAPDRIRLRRMPCPLCARPHGRPVVDGGPHFSLSHSGHLVLLAVAVTPVGVDVQEFPAEDVADEMSGALHPRERRELAARPPGERAAAFTRAWARKEAYLKGIGTGLARDTSLDYVGTAPGHAVGPAGWHIEDVLVPPGYAAAVATAHPHPRAT